MADQPHEAGIWFVLTGAEEQGSLGSAHMVQWLLDEPVNVEAVIAPDMIGYWPLGEGDAMDILGNEDSEHLVEGMSEIADLLGVAHKTWVFHAYCYGDDHTNFQEAGIPAIAPMDCVEAHNVSGSGESTPHYHKTHRHLRHAAHAVHPRRQQRAGRGGLGVGGAGHLGPMRAATLCALAAMGCTEPTAEPVTVDTLDLATTLASQGAETWPAESLYFDWMQTVWAFGLARLYVAGGDSRWLDYDRDWMVDELDRFEGEDSYTVTSSDSLSPAIVASTVMIEEQAAGLELTDLSPILDAADAYLAIAPTTTSGAIEHWSEDSMFSIPDQVWIDSMFMLGMYWLQEARRTGNATHWTTFEDQYVLFSELCRDSDTHLYRHAWDDVEGVHIPSEQVYWARGNSWVLVAAAEYLDQVGVDDPAAAEVLSLYQAHAQAILALQADDGLWHTVMNSPQGEDPLNYTETSASALIGYGLVRGIEAGALTGEQWPTAVAATVAGVESRIEADGDALVLTGTSFGTNPGEYDDYVDVPLVDDLVLGVGAAVMFLAEAHGLVVPP